MRRLEIESSRGPTPRAPGRNRQWDQLVRRRALYEQNAKEIEVKLADLGQANASDFYVRELQERLGTLRQRVAEADAAIDEAEGPQGDSGT